MSGFNGVLNLRIRVDMRFIKYDAVRIASYQNCFGTLGVNISDPATSRRCLFFLSAIPLYCGVSTHELGCIIPLFER